MYVDLLDINYHFKHFVLNDEFLFKCHLNLSDFHATDPKYTHKAGVSGFWCHRLERPASPSRICAVTRGLQTTTQDLSVFPFLPRHYHMTRVLVSPFITTVWTPVVLAIINIV